MKPALIFVWAAMACASAAEIRLGIIGTDTSHVPGLARAFNDASSADHVAGFRVVAAYKGGSKDLEVSFNRVDNFAKEIQTKYGVEIVPDIRTLLSKVDGVLLTSVDGRAHLEQAKAAIAAHKPMFIDKPLATTLEDAREIARLAKEAGVPWFSSSSLRYSANVSQLKVPGVQGATTWGPLSFLPHHYLDLSWYGIHAIEMLYAIMGPGCESVTRTSGSNAEVVVGRWKDGRIGIARGNVQNSEYGGVAYLAKGVVEAHGGGSGSVTKEIAKFFETGKPPVPNEETLEIFAFLDAAQRSKEQGGKPVTLR